MAFKASTFIFGTLLLSLLTIDTVRSSCDTSDSTAGPTTNPPTAGPSTTRTSTAGSTAGPSTTRTSTAGSTAGPSTTRTSTAGSTAGPSTTRTSTAGSTAGPSTTRTSTAGSTAGPSTTRTSTAGSTAGPSTTRTSTAGSTAGPSTTRTSTAGSTAGPTTTPNPCDVSTIVCQNNGTKFITNDGQCNCSCPNPWTGVDCDEIKPFNYRGCADDFLAVIADGVELGHTRKINTSISVPIPQGTKVLGIRAQNSFLGGGWKGIADDGRYPSNALWRCTNETQLDNRWASEGFDDSSWPFIQPRYAKTNYTWMCADFPLEAKWVWIDNYTYLGIIYCRLTLIPTDDTAPKCAAHCLSCTTNGVGKCDVGNCYPGYAFDPASLTCDGKCTQFCSKCDVNGANKCDPGYCTSGYSYNTTSELCVPIFFTACSNDNYWLYADGIFQKAITKPSASSVMRSFQVPAFTVVLAVRDNNNITGSAGWRGYLSDLSVVSDSSWKCTTSVPNDNDWKERDFDDSAWPPAFTSDNIYAPLPIPATCATGFPDSAKFLWTDSTFASSTNVTSYCRLRIDWQ